MTQKTAMLRQGIDMRLVGQRALAVEPELVGIARRRRFAMLTLSKRRAAHATCCCVEVQFAIAM